MEKGRVTEASGGPDELLRRIPQIDRLLSTEELSALIDRHSRKEVTHVLRETLDRLRTRGRNGSLRAEEIEPPAICHRVNEALARRATPYYRRVINGTGVVLHTGLGRAPLSLEAVRALTHLGPHPVRVEMDLETGARGNRDEGCASLLRELTGCEAATVVNNNAGATLLILSALARGRKVLLSRGEMVEIGGSYRVPEIMQEGGATLVGVGTTNRTHARDYEVAVDGDTAMILKVHTSNYRVQGFTSEVSIEELVSIGHRKDVPVVHDLGSGCLVDLDAHDVHGEPQVVRSVSAGADLICFSGDKLLGGPQAGIILGRREHVDRCRSHPLYRALRPGRLTYIALENTLRVYRAGDVAALEKIPALARLTTPPARLRRRALRLARRAAALEALTVDVVPCASQAGSGSLPARDLSSWAVQIRIASGSAEALAKELRTGDPPILALIRDDALLLDVRTLDDAELSIVSDRLAEILSH